MPVIALPLIPALIAQGGSRGAYETIHDTAYARGFRTLVVRAVKECEFRRRGHCVRPVQVRGGIRLFRPDSPVNQPHQEG